MKNYPFDTSISEKNLKEVIKMLEKKGINPEEYKKLETFLEKGIYEKFVTFLGWKQITGSLSPLMHTLNSLNLSSEKTLFYTLVIVNKTRTNIESILETIENTDSILGSNVTMPYKEDVFDFFNEKWQLDRSAQVAGAVNTLAKNENGKIIAYNTDIDGVIWPIYEKLGDNITWKRACILGSGGAAKAAIVWLLQKWVKHITICNRKKGNAENLKEHFLSSEVQELLWVSEFTIKIVEYDVAQDDISAFPELQEGTILINTLPFWFKEENPKMPIKEEEIEKLKNKIILYFDAVYDKDKWDTPLMTRVKKDFPGIKTCDGLDMLIGQAKKWFELWTKEEFNTDFIKKLLR